MTWTLLVALAVGSYGLRAAGTILGGFRVPARVAGAIALLPAAILSALAAMQALHDGTGLAADARLTGVAVAALFLMLRAPFVVVVAAAMVATAVTRMLG